MSYCVDANVFMTAWYVTYPPDVMPTLYKELETKLLNNIIFIKPIFDEIEPTSDKKTKEDLEKDHSVRLWLQEKLQIQATPINGDVEQLALNLMNKYETTDRPKGANSEDIRLIAFALLNRHTVVTLEAEQKQMSRKKSNYKIPLICQHEKVTCIDFVKLLRELRITI